MTATVGAFLDAAFAVVTDPAIFYDNPPTDARCHPEWSGFCDCSGLECRAYEVAGHPIGCTNSWTLASIGHQLGLGISIEDARHTPSLLFIGANEGQTNINRVGHTGISPGLGDRTYEARGHIAGVGIFPWRSSRWAWACRIPYLDYTDLGHAPPAVTPKESPVALSRIIPGTHAQTRGPTKGRFPMIVAVEADDGTTALVGVNGAQIPGGHNGFGVSTLPLGRLNAPITSIDPATDAQGNFNGWMISVAAGDNGIFPVRPTVHYA